MLTHRHSLTLSALLLLGGCFGTEAGNPPLTAELTLDAHSTDPTRIGLDVAASEAIVEEVWVRVGPVRFIGDDNCESPEEAMAQVPAVGADDHADGVPSRASFETTERSFCTVEIGVEDRGILPPGAPPEFEAASIVVVGRRADDTPFVVVSARVEPVQATAREGRFALSEDRNGLFVGFDVATWFEGLDLDGATVGPGPRIVIDSSNNATLSQAFEANLAGGVELYLDQDGDAVPDEPTPLASGI